MLLRLLCKKRFHIRVLIWCLNCKLVAVHFLLNTVDFRIQIRLSKCRHIGNTIGQIINVDLVIINRRFTFCDLRICLFQFASLFIIVLDIGIIIGRADLAAQLALTFFIGNRFLIEADHHIARLDNVAFYHVDTFYRYIGRRKKGLGILCLNNSTCTKFGADISYKGLVCIYWNTLITSTKYRCCNQHDHQYDSYRNDDFQRFLFALFLWLCPFCILCRFFTLIHFHFLPHSLFSCLK